MPDPVKILLSVLVAGVVGLLFVALLRRPWKNPKAVWIAFGGTVAVVAGFFVGAMVLGVKPRFPALEDQQRWLVLLLPLAVVVELIAPFEAAPRRLVWLLRGAVCVALPRILLHGSAYVADAAGPGSRLWSTTETGLICVAIGAGLLAGWYSLLSLEKRSPGGSLFGVLIGTTLGAALTVMLSGYSTGGQLGFPATAALAGASLGALLPPRITRTGGTWGAGMLSTGIVNLAALLVIGRYFGELGTVPAVILFAAPQVAWFPELVPSVRSRHWLRDTVRLVLAASIVAAVVLFAQLQFTRASAPGSSTQDGPSADDYMNY